MAVKDWSITAGSNAGILSGITLDGSILNVPLLDDSFRELAAQVAAQLGKIGYKGADLPSAATTDLSTATGWYVDVTGTTTITALGTVAAGQMFVLRFSASLILTHNASTLILPSGGNVTTTGGDVAMFMSLGGGAWRCVAYTSIGLQMLRQSSGDVEIYNNGVRMLVITSAGDLRMKGDVISDYPGI